MKHDIKLNPGDEIHFSVDSEPAQDTLPPLPKGAVYLGMGGDFETDSNFKGWVYEEACGHFWLAGDGLVGFAHDLHYAAPADSEVARLNGLPKEPAAKWLTEEDIAALWENNRESTNALMAIKLSDRLTRKYGSPDDLVPVDALAKLHPKLKAAIEGGEK